MKVKRYVADSIQEAIARVKHDLGRNAIILHTKQVKEGGFMGFFAQRRFEVIAAVDENISNQTSVSNDRKTGAKPLEAPVSASKTGTVAQSALSQPAATLRPTQSPPASPTLHPAPVDPPLQLFRPFPVEGQAQSHTAAARTGVLEKSQPEPVAKAESAMVAEPVLEKLHHEISDLKRLIINSAANPSDAERNSLWGSVRKQLKELDLEEEVIDHLLAQLPPHIMEAASASEKVALARCGQVLVNSLRFDEGILSNTGDQPQVVAFIGPTGVGKTTTIAKLAANFSLYHGKKVGLITLDTFRIAAVEHLKTYGDIINIPVEVIYTEADIDKALQNLQECELILVDTAGRSPYNKTMILDLDRFLSHPAITQIMLVISATTKYQDMLNIADYFSEIRYTHLIFSKLDETNNIGPIISLAWKTKSSLAYLTTGQNVPDDIEIANPARLISHLYKGNIYG